MAAPSLCTGPVAAVSNLAEEKHLVGRLYETLDGELDRRGEMIAALDDCPDVTTYNQRRLQDPPLRAGLLGAGIVDLLRQRPYDLEAG